jgi:copper chaperone CopZ
MKYKGYEVKINLVPEHNTLTYDIPDIDKKTRTCKWMSINECVDEIKDTIDLHIGRSAERETCEKRIDPEEVAKIIYEKVFVRFNYSHDWKNICKENKNIYLDSANDVIACIKKIDPSIISDDINYSKIHEFSRDAIARICVSLDSVSLDSLPIDGQKYWLSVADNIISYLEEVIYG